MTHVLIHQCSMQQKLYLELSAKYETGDECVLRCPSSCPQQDNIDDCIRKKRNKTPPKKDWISIITKCQRHHWQKLNIEDIPKIREMLKNPNKNYTRIGKIFGVSRKAISRIESGENWHYA